MPRISEMTPSNFLRKEDCEPPILVKINNVAQHNVAMDNQPQDMKWCLEFQENICPLVLNKTNMLMLEAITGSDNSDDWIGRMVVLFNDKTIQFQGKLTGGIRIRAPKANYVPPDAQDQMAKNTSAVSGNQIPDYEGDDQIPF